MEMHYNPYNRIQTYMRKMADYNDDDFENSGISLSDLAEQTEIPINVIRSDFNVLLAFGEYLHFNINDESEAYNAIDKKYGLSELLDTEVKDYRKKLKELLLAGKMDEVLFSYAGENSEEKFTLPLKPSEYEAYLRLMDQNSGKGLKSLFLIKDGIRFKSTLEVFENLEEITYAIKEGKSLRIKYRPRNGSGKIRDLKIKPLKIIYDTVENEYAVLTIYRHVAEVYRLSNINYAKIIKEDIAIPEKDMQRIANINQVWGMNFTGKPVKVKVRFENFGDVWNKVRKNLAYRSQGILEEKNGFLYYEDTVYGIDAFRSWIYSLGSAAVVIEPASLREQIIKSLEERLAEY